MILRPTPNWRSSKEILPRAVGNTLAAAAVPYGYTVTVWSSGAILARRHGIPTAAEVFAFAGGAVAGFSVAALVLLCTHGVPQVPLRPVQRLVAGALNWLAVGVAIASVAGLARFHGWAAWPLSSFVATVLYVSIASAQLAILTLLDSDGENP